MVFKGHDKNEDSSGMMSKPQASKFISKVRSGNSQYTSTNSSVAGLEYAKISEADVQEEFMRLYTQLELLKEKNMRVGNRHLASKITAMQNAACKHDHDQEATKRGSKNMLKDKVSTTRIQEETSCDTSATTPSTGKVKRPSVSFAQADVNGESTAIKTTTDDSQEESTSATEGSIELGSREDQSSTPPTVNVAAVSSASESPSSSRNGRVLKSGHARTHAIVINLDDKSRFTEEVTV